MTGERAYPPDPARSKVSRMADACLGAVGKVVFLNPTCNLQARGVAVWTSAPMGGQ